MRRLFKRLRLWLIRKLKATPNEEVSNRIYYTNADECLTYCRVYSEDEYRHLLERSGAEFVWNDVMERAYVYFAPMLFNMCRVDKIINPITDNISFRVTLRVADMGKEHGKDNFAKETEDYAHLHCINLNHIKLEERK